jgi:monothiol glutaredoxin
MSDSHGSPFQVASEETATGGAPVREPDRSAPVHQRIDQMVRSSDIFLFIKGTPQQPMCGFSANTVAIMDSLEVRYSTFDVLSDEGIRTAAKEYAGWPTFPQVYVRGEFVGGNDIVTEMLYSGDLRQMVYGEGL